MNMTYNEYTEKHKSINFRSVKVTRTFDWVDETKKEKSDLVIDRGNRIWIKDGELEYLEKPKSGCEKCHEGSRFLSTKSLVIAKEVVSDLQKAIEYCESNP